MSSLFGSKPPGSSLFGATSAPAQPSSIQTSSLFGSTQTPSPSSNPGGLFGGSTTTQAQQGSSIFSSSGSQSRSTTFPSIFSTSQPQQSSAPTGSSLFAPVASQPQQTSNLFGAPASTAPSQTATSSLFAPQQPPQQQSQQQGLEQAQHQIGQGPIAPKGAQPAYFDSLLDKGKKRTRDADGGPGFRDLPRVQLGLGDIAKRVRELGSAGTASKDWKGADSRACVLYQKPRPIMLIECIGIISSLPRVLIREPPVAILTH